MEQQIDAARVRAKELRDKYGRHAADVAKDILDAVRHTPDYNERQFWVFVLDAIQAVPVTTPVVWGADGFTVWGKIPIVTDPNGTA